MKGRTVRTDSEIMEDLGHRLRSYRLQQNVSQRALALRAGVSLRTLHNVEAGEDLQLSTLLRLLRALGRADAIDALLPVPQISPMDLLKTGKRRRQRARARKVRRG
jgi:transcriptional regulator with XRE-family HTH domain